MFTCTCSNIVIGLLFVFHHFGQKIIHFIAANLTCNASSHVITQTIGETEVRKTRKNDYLAFNLQTTGMNVYLMRLIYQYMFAGLNFSLRQASK